MKLTTAILKSKIKELLKDPKHLNKLTIFCNETIDYALPADPTKIVWKRTSKRKSDDNNVVRLFAVIEDGDESEAACKIVSDPTDTTIVKVLFGAVFEPSDFYYAFCMGGEDKAVVVTLKSVFDTEGYVSDRSEADTVVPPRFHRMMESYYEYPGSEDNARRILNAAGFTESSKLQAFLNRNQ